MNNILIYCRPVNSNERNSVKSNSIADQTVSILSEQLQHLGLHVEISHSLNFPRLLLNSYQTVHFIIEDMPLSLNEAFYFSICNALGKSTVLSILNSERKITQSWLDFIKPDAFSVSQTNHLKLYRQISGNKFIFSAFPKAANSTKKTKFKGDALLIPLQNKIDEVFEYKLKATVYFDGRKLLNYQASAPLRKKWNELIASGKIPAHHHLILSDSKLNELLNEESLGVVLADPLIKNTELTAWLNICLNKNNLIILNDFQATGFSSYWTSGRNCLVISAQDWKTELESLQTPIENLADFVPTAFRASELFEPTVNELSRLYAKIWQQKTSLLTSKSVKL